MIPRHPKYSQVYKVSKDCLTKRKPWLLAFFGMVTLTTYHKPGPDSSRSTSVVARTSSCRFFWISEIYFRKQERNPNIERLRSINIPSLDHDTTSFGIGRSGLKIKTITVLRFVLCSLHFDLKLGSPKLCSPRCQKASDALFKAASYCLCMAWRVQNFSPAAAEPVGPRRSPSIQPRADKAGDIVKKKHRG